MKYLKGINGCVITHKRAMEMINEGIVTDLGKKKIQRSFFAAWQFVFNEDLLGLDDNEFLGVQDTNDNVKKAQFNEAEELTRPNVDGASGLVDELKINDAVVKDNEEELAREVDVAATKLELSPFNSLRQQLDAMKKASSPTKSAPLPTISLPCVPPIP